MRTTSVVVAAALIGALASPAVAQKKGEGKGDEDVAGAYDVRYEEVSSNCSTTSIALNRGALDISKKGRQIVIDIQRFPLMYGPVAKAGKVRASSKIAKSSIDGVDGKFSVAGKVEEGLIQLVFVAEYYVSGKPLCSQTWNVSGQKSTSAKSGRARSVRGNES
jgi:hypothetical protein